MASDGLGKTMEETAGAEPNYAPVVGAGLWEHARLCSLSRDNLPPAPTGGRLHLYVSGQVLLQGSLPHWQVSYSDTLGWARRAKGR